MSKKRPVITQPGQAYPAGAVAVTLEPRPGHTDEDVLKVLKQHGASEVEVIAPGFISAVAPGEVLRTAEAVAHVHVKPQQQMR